jgi:tetratricopeptide (TPR) repeat protein
MEEEFMLRQLNRHGWRTAALVALVTLGLIGPVMAQGAIVKGRVVNEKLEPIEGAIVTVREEARSSRAVTMKTGRNGEFFQVGLGPGAHVLTAEKDKIVSKPLTERLRVGETVIVELLIPVLTAAAAGASSNAELEAKLAADKERARLREVLGSTFDEGVAASNAGRYDEAIAKFNEGVKLEPNCFDCYSNIGYAHLQKKEYTEAEAAYKRAVEIKSDYQAGYMGLANVYNAQRKFDLAAEASAKAAQLGGAAGGADPEAAYSQGVILFNSGKLAEARNIFQQVVKANPSHAEAHYMLGMTLAGEDPGGAVSAMETYLKLAPTGPNATTAKAIIDALKK